MVLSKAFPVPFETSKLIIAIIIAQIVKYLNRDVISGGEPGTRPHDS